MLALRGASVSFPYPLILIRQNMHSRADIVVAGGGLVGSACAAALANAEALKNKKIILLEGSPKKMYKMGPEYSNRVAALNPATVRLLERLGAWQHIVSTRACPVNRMQVWDGCSQAAITFSSSDPEEEEGEGEGPLNYIVENDVTQASLDRAMAACSSNLSVVYSTRVAEYHLPKETSGGQRLDPVRIVLDNGDVIETSLLVGADGFRSLVRSTLGCQTMEWEYGQMGLVATLQLAPSTTTSSSYLKYNNTAFQRFLSTGPVAVLPLSPAHSSLVWTLPVEQAKMLCKVEEGDFVRQLNSSLRERSREESGLVNLLTSSLDTLLTRLPMHHTRQPLEKPPHIIGAKGRAIFPLGFSHSTRYVGPRVVLIGDAAHRVHPLAGQGVNLGFGDVDALVRTITESVREGSDLGSHAHLYRYETERQQQNVPIMFSIDALQKLYGTSLPPVVLARSLGLQLTNAIPPLKNALMSGARSGLRFFA